MVVGTATDLLTVDTTARGFDAKPLVQKEQCGALLYGRFCFDPLWASS
jgi:hypothetical protein